jgi:hypothetical protein
MQAVRTRRLSRKTREWVIRISLGLMTFEFALLALACILSKFDRAVSSPEHTRMMLQCVVGHVVMGTFVLLICRREGIYPRSWEVGK